MTLLAQISDLHVQTPESLAYGVVDTNRLVERAIASSQPSLVHQGGFDLRPNTASHFVMEPLAYQIHIWENASLVSHTVFVGDFDGPYRFSDGQKMTVTMS